LTAVTGAADACPPPWTAITMAAVQPATASAAPDVHATFFRDMLLNVLPPLL
jgi:hypothetical protein